MYVEFSQWKLRLLLTRELTAKVQYTHPSCFCVFFCLRSLFVCVFSSVLCNFCISCFWCLELSACSIPSALCLIMLYFCSVLPVFLFSSRGPCSSVVPCALLPLVRGALFLSCCFASFLYLGLYFCADLRFLFRVPGMLWPMYNMTPWYTCACVAFWVEDNEWCSVSWDTLWFDFV